MLSRSKNWIWGGRLGVLERVVPPNYVRVFVFELSLDIQNVAP